MAEFGVTGVRYQFRGKTLDEKTEAAKAFVASLANGTPVILAAEPDNVMDTDAIAVYMDYTHHVGYMKHENCKEVAKLLDANGQCNAVVCGNDGHVTFFIDIPNAPELPETERQNERILPESPLPKDVCLAFSDEERALQVVAPRLVSMPVKADTLNDIQTMVECYMPLSRLSITREDDLWRDRVYRLLRKACRQNMPDEQKKLFEAERDRLKATIGDFHRTHEHWIRKVFEEQLQRLRIEAQAEGGFFAKVQRYLKQKKIGLHSLEFSLYDWFDAMPRIDLCDPKQHASLADGLSYLGVSRRELYDVYAALLLLEWLEVQLKGKTMGTILAKLRPIFYGDDGEARKFLSDINGMKPKQITQLVRELSGKRKISELSRGRELWTVLHDAGFYPHTESNWNQQIKEKD